MAAILWLRKFEIFQDFFDFEIEKIKEDKERGGGGGRGRGMVVEGVGGVGQAGEESRRRMRMTPAINQRVA